MGSDDSLAHIGRPEDEETAQERPNFTPPKLEPEDITRLSASNSTSQMGEDADEDKLLVLLCKGCSCCKRTIQDYEDLDISIMCQGAEKCGAFLCCECGEKQGWEREALGWQECLDCESARCPACKALPKADRPSCDPDVNCSEHFGECDCETPEGEPKTCADCGEKKVCENCAGGSCDHCDHGRNPGELLCSDCSDRNVKTCSGCGVSVCDMCSTHHSRGTCDCDDGNFGAKYSETSPAWYHGGAGGRYTGPYM